ncbi:hypothetical protein COCOBI_10-1480 [Coccomyxa sp. Obi]|nr:hypothetical protein COCOBI_10-1480 [Coccomyxa sp. Obi]
MTRIKSRKISLNIRSGTKTGAGHSAPSRGVEAPARTRYSRQAKSDEAREAHTSKRGQLSDGERKAEERLASRAPRQRKAKCTPSAEAPDASVQASAAELEPASLHSIFLDAADVLQASESLVQLSGVAFRAFSATTAQLEQYATDVHGTSKPAAPIPQSTEPLPICSNQEAAPKIPSGSQTTAEPAPTSTQEYGADSSALSTDTMEPILAASSREQGTSATGASAMPAGKTAKPAQTGLSVRRRQRKPASPRSGMPRPENEMPAPGLQDVDTGIRSRPQTGAQKKPPTKKCRRAPENVAPCTTAAAQPKACSHRRTAEQQMGGAAQSTEPITLRLIFGRKRTRTALAEMENAGTAAAAAAASGQPNTMAADISAQVTGEEGTPAKRRRDTAPEAPTAAATEARAVPQQTGGSADRQSSDSSAASAGELEAQQAGQQAADMEMDGHTTSVPTASIIDGTPSTGVEVEDHTTMAGPSKAASSRRALRVRRDTNTSTSLETCPPSPPKAMMPQAPLLQMNSSSGRAGGVMRAVAEVGMGMEAEAAKPAARTGRNVQKKRGHREVQELCAASQRVLRPRRQ